MEAPETFYFNRTLFLSIFYPIYMLQRDAGDVSMYFACHNITIPHSNVIMKRVYLSLLIPALVLVLIGRNQQFYANSTIFIDYKQFPGSFWLGETIRFTPEETEHGVYLRQRGNPSAGSHHLYGSTGVHYGAWEFSVQFDGFSSSNQNRAWVWLMNDDPQNPSGYAVRIGESGSMKFVRLFRLMGSSPPVEVMQSSLAIPDDNRPVFIRVERAGNGLWRLGVRNHFHNHYQWSETSDTVPPTYAPFFGFQTQFTSTRADRFLFGTVSIEPSPLSVLDVRLESSTNIILTLTEALPEVDALFPNLVLRRDDHNTTGVSSMAITGPFTLRIELTHPLSGGQYLLETGDYTDPRTGLLQPSLSFPLSVYDEPEFGDVVINEITLRTGHDGTPPFIELYNHSSKILNINGWSIGRGTQSLNLPDLTIHPDSYVVISRNPLPADTDQHGIRLVLPVPAWSVSQDQLWLRSDRGGLIDSMAYSSSITSTLIPGQSLERIDPTYPGTDAANWIPHLMLHHSAGKINSNAGVTLPDLTLQRARLVAPDTLLIEFNLIVSMDGLTQITVNGTPPAFIEWARSEGHFLRVALPCSAEWAGTRSGHLQIDSIRRFGSGSRYYFSMEIAQPIQQMHDLLVNEIMYQPLQQRYGRHSDQSEYIELINTRPYVLDLSSLFIADSPDKNGIFRSWVPEAPDNWKVEPFGYAVVHADTASTWESTRLAQFFQLHESTAFARVNRSTLGLNASGRGIYIRSGNLVVDSVYYSPEWHHPYVHDPRGRSLERVSEHPEWPAQWSTSAAPRGGTPGSRNTITDQHLTTLQTETGSGLFIAPNPFSPDMDGFEDMAAIRLIPPTHGYQLTLRIFNRTGRLVRTLERDTMIGSEFSTIWDGTGSSGNLLPTDVYILHAELHHPDKRSVSFMETVVLVRRS